MKKVLSLLLILILLFSISACNNSNNSDNTQEPDTPIEDENSNLKYDVVDGEVIINDSNLINSTQIDDNYRVFYEIFTGSFSDSNGDGIGDLKGIINRLDYLNDGNPNSGKSLGIQGIWLTPIFSSPTYHKYDVTDYYSIDSSFGSLDDLKILINECKKRNIKLILDLPINHTGEQNDWYKRFVKAHQQNDTTNPFYNFYVYYKQGDTLPAGRTFNKIVGTSDYYECNFSGNMPELNFDNEIVRQEVLNIAKYYIALGIDGFRFDAAKYIYFGDETKSAEFWNWYVTELKKIKSDIYTVGEVWSGDGVTDMYYKQGLNCFNFTVSQAEGRIAMAAKEGNIAVYTNYIQNYVNNIKSLNNDAMMMPFIANHDTDRAAGFLQLSNGYAKMAANLYLLSSGSPFIYYGEEIGMKGTRGSANSDANRRLAMLWGDNDSIKNPSEATFKDKNQTNGTVSTQIVDENSLLTHYKKVIMIRNANPEIARGEYVSLQSNNDTIGGFTSTYNNKTVCVIHNSGLESVTIDLTTLTNQKFTKISGYTGLDEATFENNKIIIGAQSSIVLR